MKLLFAILGSLPAYVLASADCPVYPKEEWAAQGALKQALQEEGYKIKKFKIDGNCYEMYGLNKDGKKVEIYFDMKTLGIVKAEGIKD